MFTKMFLSLIIMGFLISAHAETYDKRWENNKAMENYCPGWCCPGYIDQVLNNSSEEYCLNNPNAKTPPWEIKELEKSNETYFSKD